MVPPPQEVNAMGYRRRKPRSAYTIYRNPNGDGWILTAMGDHESVSGGHRFPLVFYYINGADASECEVVTDKVINRRNVNGVDRALRSYCGAKLAPYEGTKPEADTRFEDQPRAVRMQRHAVDIYRTLGNARGLSETLCVRAAEEFGSTWREKDRDDWQSRVQGVGEGRANSIVLEAERRGLASQ